MARISISNLVLYGSGLAFMSMSAGLGPLVGLGAVLAATGVEMITESLREKKILRQQQVLSKMFEEAYARTEPSFTDEAGFVAVDNN